MYKGICPLCKTKARIGILPLEPKGLMIIDRIAVTCTCGEEFYVIYEPPSQERDEGELDD